jgi:hypothetical protein
MQRVYTVTPEHHERTVTERPAEWPRLGDGVDEGGVRGVSGGYQGGMRGV